MASLDPDRVADCSSASAILDTFLEFLLEAGIDPYPHQEEAILELFEGKNVILNTPTGSGKSLVALALHFRALCQNRRSYYTVPIKALANEKFLSLCETFGADQVGMITGDATVNPEASVICCTAEILANLALREGSLAQVDEVIMDEFHYYSDHDRGWAWQVPLLTLPQSRFLLMSATLGDIEFFQKGLTELTGAETTIVQSAERPVPLDFEYSHTPLEDKVTELVEADRAPVYLVHFTQLACARSAQNLMSRNFCTKEEKAEIGKILSEGDFRSPYGKEMAKFLRHGLGVHHAGLLPKYRVLVEKLAQKGLLKVICGTDTLGVGVNVPIRTVVFTQLCKFGGQGTSILTVRDFRQVAGRAGRRGFDSIGYVVAQAPEHVIENLKADEKAAAKGKKNKAPRKKPPERGYVNWDEKTYLKLQTDPPEKLTSQFRVRHAMLLNVLGRVGEDGCAELKRIIDSSHETLSRKKALRKEARDLFMGLVRGKVLTIIPAADRITPAKVQLNVDLQEDFSLNQALGLFLIESIPEIPGEGTERTLRILSFVEAILEDPAIILRSQVRKEKSELVAQMKEEGYEYDDRMEALEEVEHPKPEAEVIYQMYNDFVVRNPWAKAAGVRPKNVAREMFENWSSFEDYVKNYALEKSEAVLLRHLSEVWKVLAQTVPEALKDESLIEAEEFFETLVRTVDSSLLDEWEKMQNPEGLAEKEATPLPVKKAPLTRRKAEFERSVRRAVFDVIKTMAHGTWSRMGELDGYFDEHEMIRLDPEARSKQHFRWKDDQVEQTLIDENGDNDWEVIFQLDRKASDEQDQAVLVVDEVRPIGV